MEKTLEWYVAHTEALKQELAKKDAIIAEKDNRLTEALRYVNDYVQTLEVIQSEL